MEDKNSLRLYTSLPVLLDMLQSGKLRFREPSQWDDKNDANLIEIYKKRKGLSEVLVLCFTFTDERFHHWKAYADGTAGCCIVFDKSKLLDPLGDTTSKDSSLCAGEVKTLFLGEQNVEPSPFNKRHAYEDDKEFRILSQAKKGKTVLKELDIDWSSVKEIILSPKLRRTTKADKEVVNSIKKSIKKLLPRKPDHSPYEITLRQSTIYESERYIEMFKRE